MKWLDALQVSTLVITSLGGGGLIVFGLSRFLGDKWLQDWKGEIDAKLQRLDAALEHRNFLLQKLAEFELEALTECWRAARACLPHMNAARAHDSGTDPEDLKRHYGLLADAHNKLLSAVGRHELLLDNPVADVLDSIGKVLRLELSNIQHHKPFDGAWWEEGEKNQNEFRELSKTLLALIKTRVTELKATAANE